jgi:thioesterase domain-containing protein
LNKCTLGSPATSSIAYRQNAGSHLYVADTNDGDPTGLQPIERRHVVPVRTSGDRPPLFCIFPGPPGSSEFVEFLPDDQPSYDFYFTKLDGSVNFPVVEQLALTFLRELREIQPRGPYQLCGYSKAGLVAYEMARLLLSQGEDVLFLALFETWHPGFEKNLTRGELVQFRVLHIADRLQQYGHDLVRGRFSVVADIAWKAISRRVKKLGWQTTRRFFKTSSQPVPKGMQLVEAIVVLKSFVPKSYPKRFILVRTDDPFERKLKDQTLGWRVCATQGVDVYFVPGEQDHGTMLDKPHVRDVIEKLMPHLAEPHGA